MIPKPLFDDEYTGARFTYGLQYRPLDLGTAPKGWIIGSSHVSTDRRARFGSIDYPRQLTDDEIKAFELVHLGSSKGETA